MIMSCLYLHYTRPNKGLQRGVLQVLGTWLLHCPQDFIAKFGGEWYNDFRSETPFLAWEPLTPVPGGRRANRFFGLVRPWSTHHSNLCGDVISELVPAISRGQRWIG